MPSPTPSQQAAYLRRLLRRGELEILDPATGQPQAALVGVVGGTIQLVPTARFDTDAEARAVKDPEWERPQAVQQRWLWILHQLRATLAVEEAEALVRAVLSERQRPRT